jgi:SAM-dependent MidA family methyltransferase
MTTLPISALSALDLTSSGLLKPNAEALAHSQQLALLIQERISQNDGWVSFAEFMNMALYQPNLGYYSGGAKKFGLEGDFVTAPEISPIFAKTLARQVAEVLTQTQGDILELGAGTGKLAAELLLTLQALDRLPVRYYILEVSAHLRQIQLETLQARLPERLMLQVVWLDTLPTHFTGLIFGNEVLDAIPVHLIYNTESDLFERGISFDNGFIWQDRQLTSPELYDVVSAYSLPNDYLTEVCPAAAGLVHSLAKALERGVILMLDYGFSGYEYYHPQRNQGTLMCHYRHFAHSDPLINIGLQDITAHVDFTNIAHSGINQGLDLAGFCTQAHFLMNCGILDIISQVSPNDMALYVPLAAAAQKLLSPAEMGDLFKVIAFSKDIEQPLLGFMSGDKSHTL